MKTVTRTSYALNSETNIYDKLVTEECFIGDALGCILQPGDKVAWIRNPSLNARIVTGTLKEIVEKKDSRGYVNYTLICEPDAISKTVARCEKDSRLEIGLNWKAVRKVMGIPVYTWPRILKLQNDELNWAK